MKAKLQLFHELYIHLCLPVDGVVNVVQMCYKTK